MCFVCLDGCAARREQMETEQPVGEHRTDRKGKRGLSSASTQAPSCQNCTLERP